jgi:hypothetical protein
MTSHPGSDIIQQMAGEECYEEMKQAVMEIPVGRFAPGDTLHVEVEKGELIFTATR